MNEDLNATAPKVADLRNPAPADWILDPARVEAEYAEESALRERTRAFQELLEGEDADDVAQQRLRRLKPKRLLDAGCGLGEFGAWACAELGARVLAVDLSPRMVAVAAARGLQAIVADLRTLPFEAGSFDCVVANSVLYHFDDPSEAIAELARVLEPGGHLLAVTGSNRDYGRNAAWERLFGTPVPRQPPLSFSRENGDTFLTSTFRSVERVDCEGVLVFRTRGRLVDYVESLPLGRGAGDEVPELDAPFRLPVSSSVFIATR